MTEALNRQGPYASFRDPFKCPIRTIFLKKIHLTVTIV